MTFYVGQKVVCVDDRPIDYGARPGFYTIGDLDGLTRGHIYTIAGFEADGGTFGLVLAEITRQVLSDRPSHHHHDGFAARRFRPVVERKTDISIFTAMLGPKQVEKVS